MKFLNAMTTLPLTSSILVFYFGLEGAFAFSAPESRQFIQIRNPLAFQQQQLPSSFVSSWPTWVLETNGDLNKIPDTDGFVSPASIDEMWQPVDLRQPELRVGLGLHVRNGMIRHVLPALDVSFDGNHRNRGLCSVPRAHSWLEFGAFSYDNWNDFELVLATRKKDDDNETSEWTRLSVCDSIQECIDSGVALLTEKEDLPEDLGDGSHLVHVLVSGVVPVECPKVGSEVRVMLKEKGDESGEVAGTLQVKISSTMAGSASEYLPNAYKPLFEDESLRREAYAAFKKRLESKKERKHEA
eukprot:CAMPEP_0118683832 /NCGR_PEP_ID=MMETSP0800-20121206/6276_1 /TAXON_ID=210618 ORGANISM="Striatella unipunctata, Strain CCMP2910" /NCGR_SAMPLE_ID=MMETSP0800 /ASSEMBLY_ACC=CAM_ASM_000638 /LENGTH=298 /DNA_ID=CAMNT_0006580409 /DNA_START=655 /DNA_END=1551 /DNA_ORIENTATION=+